MKLFAFMMITVATIQASAQSYSYRCEGNRVDRRNAWIGVNIELDVHKLRVKNHPAGPRNESHRPEDPKNAAQLRYDVPTSLGKVQFLVDGILIMGGREMHDGQRGGFAEMRIMGNGMRPSIRYELACVRK